MVHEPFDEALLSISVVAYDIFMTLPVDGLECSKTPIILVYEELLYLFLEVIHT